MIVADHLWKMMQEPLRPFSLWQALKDLIGKDILDAPLPIGQYCPLTELQFRAEELEYTELLDQVILVTIASQSYYCASILSSCPEKSSARATDASRFDGSVMES